MSSIAQPSHSSLPGSSAPFRVETADVIARLRAALSAMVASVAGGPLEKSRDAQKHFNVDVKLSWQLFRTLGSTDPLSAVGHIPPRGSFAKLVREARRREIAPELVDEAERAFDRFEQLVERHAGDRTSFSRMLDADGAFPSVEDELPQRQAAFEASRQIWGSEMDLNLHVTMIHPHAGEVSGGPSGQEWGRRRFDVASLGAIRGFRRWRTSAPVLLFKHRIPTQPDAPGPKPIVPLDAATFAELSVPLLQRFCSDPRPMLRTRRVRDDLIVTELTGDAVGRLNSIDATQGQVFPGSALMESPDGRLGWQLARIHANPTRCALIDFVVHRPTFGAMSHQTMRWGNVCSFPASLESLHDVPDVPRLPNVDKVSFVGGITAAAQTAGTANYLEMLRYVCEQRGWKLDDFDVYRHRSEFPLMSTLDSIFFTIPGSQAHHDRSVSS